MLHLPKKQTADFKLEFVNVKNNTANNDFTQYDIENNKVSSPFVAQVSKNTNIYKLLVARVEKNPNGILAQVFDSQTNKWINISAKSFLQEVKQVAMGLMVLGVKKGVKVAIMSHTSYEWMLLDYAIWAAGGISVPIYETSSPSQVKHIVSDSDSKLLIVQNQEFASIAIEAMPHIQGGYSVPGIKNIYGISGIGNSLYVIEKGCIDHFKQIGAKAKILESVLKRHSYSNSLDDIATIIYTSGTTGQPKGAMLTHSNFVYQIFGLMHDKSKNSVANVACKEDSKILFFLPLSHVFARIVQTFAVSANAVVGHCGDIKQMVSMLESFKPTALIVVPRVLEKIYNASLQQANTRQKQAIFNASVHFAVEQSKAVDSTKYSMLGLNGQLKQSEHKQNEQLKTSLKQKAGYFFGKQFVYKKLQKKLGSNVREIITGGAPLGEKLAHFYKGIGISLIEGYGLTETTGPIAGTRTNSQLIGTVGMPLPGNEIKIDNKIPNEQGEILLKGAIVFKGYYKNEQATKEAFNQDGYFLSGDIGKIDKLGFLHITGRKKELLITAGGKNIAPNNLEDKLNSHPLIGQCMLVADKKPFVSLMITLDSSMISGYLKANGAYKQDLTIAQARTNETIKKALEKAIKKVNKTVSKPERIKKFRILNAEWTVQNGYLTPSYKVKRDLISQDFAPEIDSLYENIQSSVIVNVPE